MRPTAAQANACIVVLAVLLAAGAYELYQRRSPQPGLVITGTTDPNDGAPLAPVQPGAAASPKQIAAAARGNAAAQDPPNEVVVHVAGAVKHSGVYRFPSGARADDAVKKAGGAKPDANLDAINLAARLEDGEQLYVPTRAEQPAGGAPPALGGKTPGGREASGAMPTRSTHATGAGGSARPDKLTSSGQGTVNINHASAEELQRLPGVGPAMAARILDYRKTTGTFTSPDQLMNVSGIGEKKFARMQPFVRVR